MPTNDKPRKVVVNGKEVAAIKKTKLPHGIDWQAIVIEKQNELASK